MLGRCVALLSVEATALATADVVVQSHRGRRRRAPSKLCGLVLVAGQRDKELHLSSWIVLSMLVGGGDGVGGSGTGGGDTSGG